MSTGSKRIVDLQSADVLDEKDEIIFWQSTALNEVTHKALLAFSFFKQLQTYL